MKKQFLIIFLVLIFAVLACNLPTGDSVEELPANPDQQLGDQSEVEENSVSGFSNEDVGLTRSNPYPLDTEVSTPYWDFKVLEVARGEAAWQIIQADDPDNPSPPPGKEYFLVKVEVRCKHPDPGTHDIDMGNLYVTSDSLIGYSDWLVDKPQPEFFYSDIYTAETLEGWIDILVDPAEGNLMLVFDREDRVGDENQPREVRYVALEEGAQIGVPADILAVAANEIGVGLENPAKVGDIVITNQWEITILEAVRGDAAFNIAKQLSDRNMGPEEGMEYIAFRVQGRRINPADLADMLSASDFSVRIPGQGRAGGDLLDDPFIYRDRNSEVPYFVARLFPGGEIEGWAIKEVPAGYSPVILRFNHILPGLSSSEWDERYFLLEP